MPFWTHLVVSEDKTLNKPRTGTPYVHKWTNENCEKFGGAYLTERMTKSHEAFVLLVVSNSLFQDEDSDHWEFSTGKENKRKFTNKKRSGVLDCIPKQELQHVREQREAAGDDEETTWTSSSLEKPKTMMFCLVSHWKIRTTTKQLKCWLVFDDDAIPAFKL